MIRFTFLLQAFFQPNISETIQARRLKIFEGREANDLENFFKKCKNFDVSYLQLSIELHLS